MTVRRNSVRIGCARLAAATALVMAVIAGGAGPARADSAYSPLILGGCEVLQRFDETGDFDLRCPGHDGIAVFVSHTDGRMSIHFGSDRSRSISFSMFSTLGDTLEWVSDDEGVVAAIARYKLSADQERAEALVVNRIGTEEAPGCPVGVVDAAEDQANGVARGMAAMVRSFSCNQDRIAIVAGANSPVRGVSR